MEKAYDAHQTEAKWTQFWEEGKFFLANPTSERPPYCIVMPPPNVTGVLHMGHALVSTLIDILIRWKRMCGYEVLWVPGTDHAGIATQTVVERHLMQTEGKRRGDYTRDAFLKHVWIWKEQSEQTILTQLKSLGCSCDWSRLRFTMDEGCNRAVRTIFKRLYDEGLIYQGDYLVNWDPITQTALADDEVEHEERESFLWTFKYHLADGSGYVRIATTRPETLLGDTAIAVNPKDERYTHLHHQRVRLPFVDREIPIITDNFVDPTFGTGMVKVTPAHDPNDYKMGISHNLPMINIMTPDAYINEQGGPFKGLSREKAREAVVEQMKAKGLLEKVERHTLRVGVSYRSKAVIEPLLSKQWFVSMKQFAPKLKAIVDEGDVKILPDSWKQTYFHWIDNLRDWCISRQLWWGHRIPVWHHKQDGRKICHAGEGLPEEVAAAPEMWEQDPDVLDTWFSSALWPFSTLGWPDQSADLAKFYPNSVLVTGHDILFFWVARMILMGEYTFDTAPFPETFLHGLIYGRSYWKNDHYITGEEKRAYDLGKPVPNDVESKWEKLSKSKGNVIDPLEMIKEYGTDALRMTLCSIANQSPQIDLDRRRFEEYKNFANKVWNGARFVFMNLEGLTSAELAQGIARDTLLLEDRWILSAMGRLNKEVNASLTSYNFDQAAQLSYDFFWKEFCAYYVEISKSAFGGPHKVTKQKILTIVLCNMIRLLHPMAPFITEELFANLKGHFPNLVEEDADPYTVETIRALNSPACATAPYPTLLDPNDIHPEIEEEFAFAQKVVYTIRNIRGEMRIPPHIATDVYLVGAFAHPEIIKALVKTERVTVTTTLPTLPFSATGVIGDLTVVIPLPTELADQEQKRLEKERARLIDSLARIKTLLENPNFLERAKPELVASKQQELKSTELELQTIEEKLSLF